MSALNILEQLLGKGAGDLLGQLQNQGGDLFNKAQGSGGNMMDSLRDVASKGGSLLSDSDKTTLGAGALAVLVGSKADNSLAKLGGLAALGTVAFKAFQRWQQQNATATPEVSTAGGGLLGSDSIPASAPSVVQTPADQVSHALLVAMITAAKADGHIQEDEKAQLDANLAKLSDPQDRAWFQEEINRSVDPSYVASFAKSPQLAAQMYAMSLAICNEQNFMEKAYLDELAKQLDLDPGLKAELEQQVCRNA